MSKARLIDLSTAYGQLIVLVFLPISVLALFGGLLVLAHTIASARQVQQLTAQNVLFRYQQLAQDNAPTVLALNRQLVQRQNLGLTDDLQNLQNRLRNTLQGLDDPQPLQAIALVNANGQLLASKGHWDSPPSQTGLWGFLTPSSSLLNRAGSMDDVPPNTTLLPQFTIQQLIKTPSHSVSMPSSTLYAAPLTALNARDLPALWLVVDIDDQPLALARYQVLLVLVTTGLMTVLLLLLGISNYARRWIAPIYEMRLHLERTHADNLNRPLKLHARGELNQLKHDLARTLRRLHASFQELKAHAEQTEDDLRQAFDEMEMQNISIRNARDAAISASQTKSAFLANISHELRTPLNSIDGFSNLLARGGGLNPEQDLYVQTIRKSSAHLLALVNDVLDFSKIEAGKLVLNRHPYDLYRVIYDVGDMLSPLAAEKNVRLAILLYDDVPTALMGDALRVKQVLTNLVNNAIKFTDDGEVIVRVELSDERDEFLQFSVQDTGRGIPAAQQTALFQSFSQGDPSITRQYGGTGLGLVICKQLTYQMGGRIGFFANADDTSDDTKPVRGTTFWFSLPIVRATTALPPSYSLPVLPPPDKPLQLLVWLGHGASLQVLKASLRPLAIEVTSAATLMGLLEALKERGQWDWVIVDNASSEDTLALLKQVRLHYAGKLALFGYQVNLDPELLARYQVQPLYQPLERGQLYRLFDSQNAAGAAPTLPQWHGFTVLAVDDHLPNLLVLEALLAEVGVEVITASSGFEALAVLDDPAQAQRIDLIFMDIQMPRMSGSQTAAHIRERESQRTPTRHLPIIALTAHSLSDELPNLTQSGINDYVGKPIDQTQLHHVLQRWLGQAVNLDEPMFCHALPNHAEQSTESAPDLIQPTDSPTTSPAPTGVTIQHDPTDLAVIDWQDALQRAANKPDLASSLLLMLIDGTDKDRSELAAAWQAHDRQTLADVAHRILGASRYTGVPQLRHASQRFEDACLAEVSDVSASAFEQLTAHYQTLLTALDALKHADLSSFPALRYARLKEQDMVWKMI